MLRRKQRELLGIPLQTEILNETYILPKGTHSFAVCIKQSHCNISVYSDIGISLDTENAIRMFQEIIEFIKDQQENQDA